MRIYLAARFSRQAELLGYRADLIAAGHEVTSRWLVVEHDLPPGDPEQLGAKYAKDDVQDLMTAECVISFTEPPEPTPGRHRGGRHVEFGLALAMALLHDTRATLGGIQWPPMALYVVGPRENVFHHLPRVEQFDTWPACLEVLRGVR